MSNKILDQPVNLHKTIRKPYFTIVEFLLLFLNGLLVFVGVSACFYFAYTEQLWLFIVNPTVFILFFGVPPLLFIPQWRAASLEYDDSQRTIKLIDLSKQKIPRVMLFTSLLSFVFCIGLIVTAFFYLNSSRSDYMITLISIAPTLVLGPVQFFFTKSTFATIDRLVQATKKEVLT